MSVFAPESGISSSGEMSVSDSLKSLGVSEFSGSFGEIVDDSGGRSVLVNLVTCLERLSNSMEAQNLKVRLHPQKHATQTRAEDNLSKKLGELQQSYEDAVHNARTNPEKGVEEKMIAFQKECEGRLASQMQNDLNRFRAHDLDMMRLEEQAKYRNEVSALRLEMKAEYDLRVQKKEEAEVRKLNNVRMQAQALEQAQYSARQEVSRELDLVRRREVDSRREIDVRKRAVELMEQRTKNLKESLEAKEIELNSHEAGLKHKYMVEFDRAREEVRNCEERSNELIKRAKKSYEAAAASLAAQQKVVDAELTSVRRDREELQRLKKDVVEKHGSVLNDDQDFDNIRMERDSLKIKLGEVESQLAAYHVHYDNDMEEEANGGGRASPDMRGRSPSPAKLVRSLSSSTGGGGVGNPMSRSWRDHRNALESELERAERELDETRALLESERERTEELRERERATFEKAATLEAVANSLKQRLEDAERATKNAVGEKEAIQCDYDAMKIEIGELRQLMLKQQNIVEMVGRKKVVGSSSSKNDMREARLEKVRQRAKEQMKLDIKILDEKEEREKLERAREGSKSSQSETVVAAANEAASTQLEAIRRLELRLAKAEANGEKMHVMLESEKDKSRYQNEMYSMLMKQQVQQAPQVVYQQVAAAPQQHSQQQPVVAAPPQSGYVAPPSVKSVVTEPPAAQQKVTEVTKATTSAAAATKPAGSGAKSENWEQEYHDFIVSQEEEQQQQQKQMKEQKVKSQLELQQAQQRLDSVEQEKRKKKEEEEALEAAEREAELEAAREREQQERQQAAAAAANNERKKKAEDAKNAKSAELDRAERKRQKEEEEAARWEAKELERKAKKELERKEREEAAKKELEEQHLREAEDRKRIAAATRLQAQGRRRRASLQFEQLKVEKAASMSAIEKAKLEREKKAAVELAKKKAEEDAERERVSKEHDDARRRATERIREQRAREEQERAEREERERSERRMSGESAGGGGGSLGGGDSDPLEISDESFETDPDYDDW
ncbi:hypothetical protein TL16_g02484 [Triparma laevis f. inornata]|uniref:Uncharacterized protein n=1 Tax=Triparma laevis f. inornata TaxID=1714386 RepID=A0A9W7DWW7_9STRA|nr:hypothetical protein TL16_g02484 [Triparma laevis f. inornata]